MIVYLFIMGICVGSFLNVLIDRLPKGENFFSGRSYCDNCRHKLSWYDLIPIISFFILGRKCRYCKNKISWQYPVVEFATGISFTATYIYLHYLFPRIDMIFPLFYFLCIVSGMTVIFATDIKYMIIPDEIVLPLGILSIFFDIFMQKADFMNFIFSALSFSLFFLMLLLVTKGKGMGFGDVKLAFIMGLILGFPKIIVAFYLSFLTGALISAILILRKRKSFKSTIPFGPFLSASALISLFFGESLWLMIKRIMGI